MKAPRQQRGAAPAPPMTELLTGALALLVCALLAACAEAVRGLVGRRPPRVPPRVPSGARRRRGADGRPVALSKGRLGGGGGGGGDTGGDPRPGGALPGAPHGTGPDGGARPAVRSLRGIDVRFISLAGAGKNGRKILAKGERLDGRVIVEKAVPIRKSDGAKRMVYGVVYAPGGDGDADGHVASAAEIEKAMHGFMAAGRVGAVDVNHDEQTGGAYVAESWLTKTDGGGAVVDALFPGEPEGTWCVGIKVEDDGTWASVEKGEITGLSLAGVAVEEPVEKAARLAPLDVVGARPRTLVEKAKDLLASLAADRAANPSAALAPRPTVGADARAGAEAGADDDARLGVAKGFREKLLRSQLWQITEALSTGIRDVLEDDGVADKSGAVRAIVDEFEAWLTGQVTMAKAGVPAQAVDALVGQIVAVFEDAAVTDKAAAVRALVERAAERVAGRGAGADGVEKAAEECKKKDRRRDEHGCWCSGAPDRAPGGESAVGGSGGAVRKGDGAAAGALEELAKAVGSLQERVEGMERQRLGRRSHVGDDGLDVEQGGRAGAPQGKGFRFV